MITLLVTSLIFAIATSGQPGPVRTAAQPKVVTPCSMVSRAEIEQVLGQSVEKGEEEGSSCSFAGANGEVTVTLQRLASPLDLSAEIASLKSAIPGSQVREMTCLGARALLVEIEGAGAQLHVVRDRDYVMVSVLGFGDAKKAVESLGRKALGRL